MYRRGIASKDIAVSYHKACQLLATFEHVDFQFIPRWARQALLCAVTICGCCAFHCVQRGSMLVAAAGIAALPVPLWLGWARGP
jgi:hypothetical protein